jgi:mono/diheme cytochrome c family protein
MAKWSDDRRLRRHALPVLACLLAATAAVALAAGCGGAAKSNNVPTRTVVQVQHLQRDRWTYARERFRETCGGCHTLADAGTHGRRYDLDRAGGIDAQHVRYVLTEGEPGMPSWRGVLSKREFEELVAYLPTVAKHLTGETNWHWQLMLRINGERWSPQDTRNLEARYANEGAGAPTSSSSSASSER